jgi:hypothetical protein
MRGRLPFRTAPRRPPAPQKIFLPLRFRDF